MVTTSFSKEAQLRIKLPEATSEASADQALLRVTIDAHGQFFINDKQLLKPTADSLRNAMRQAAGNNSSPGVVIYADGQTPHQAVIHAMDAARRLGFTNLTFATQQQANRKK